MDLAGYSGAVGDEIVIRASDDFAVARVAVALSDGEGTPLENGPAVETPANSGRWVYAATTALAGSAAPSKRKPYKFS